MCVLVVLVIIFSTKSSAQSRQIKIIAGQTDCSQIVLESPLMSGNNCYYPEQNYDKYLTFIRAQAISSGGISVEDYCLNYYAYAGKRVCKHGEYTTGIGIYI
ncbi:MAG: hypothetical protein PHY80_06780 [Rickettsiales bacterium]|nr:hypothetical protein [Rickettsiales bacterium]